MNEKTYESTLMNNIKQYENIIVYGARYRGSILVKSIKSHFPEANIFVAVSDRGNETLHCAGIPVERLDSYVHIAESALVLIAAQPMFNVEMEATARKLGFPNVTYVEDKFYDEKTSRHSLAKRLLSGIDPGTLTDLQKKNHRYILSTNDRGLHAIELLESKGLDFKNANVLDIGCAYGGFSIEAKRRGASMVYGVDIAEHNISLARTNLEDEPEYIREGCKLDVCDITSEKALLMPNGYFDIIFITDVFEHVYDTCKFMEHLKRLAAPGCSIYFEIPNGLHFLNFIEEEPHHLVGGLSILLPKFWYEKTGYISTYYRRWEYYDALFAYFGFADVRLFNFHSKPDISKENLTSELLSKIQYFEDSLSKKISNEPLAYIKAVEDSLQNLKKELERDINEMDVDKLVFKYLSPFWQGILKKPPL